MIWPLVFPALVAGSIFTFSLTLGDFITPSLVCPDAVHRQRRLRQHHDQPAARRGLRDGPDRDHDHLPADRPPPRRLRARMRGALRLSRRAEFCSGRRRGHPRVHLHPADGDRDLRVQLEHDARMAAAEPHHPVVRRRDQQPGRPRRLPDLAQGRSRRRPRSRSSSARWPRSPSPASASSAARRSRSWSSCRSRCPGSSPASP